jgi:hypothetical protein
MDGASRASVTFIVQGVSEAQLEELWEGASGPTDADATQRLNSTIVCLSSALAIALQANRPVGAWMEHALLPIVQDVSLDLFGDVVFPDDEELDEVFQDPRVQAAAEFCVSSCSRLADSGRLQRPQLDELAREADALNGGVPSGY